MGYALASHAVAAGHEVTLLTGPVDLEPPAGCEVVRFVTVDELARAMVAHFPSADVLVMAAAVGDFQVEAPAAGKLRRSEGPIEIQLVPTEDLCAAAGKVKRPDHMIIAFAVNEGTAEQIEAAARQKLTAKGADFIVVNTPEAMSAEASSAAVLSAEGVELPWENRTKSDLAAKILKLIQQRGQSTGD